MYSNKLYTPLRYPGGKARFAPFIAALMERNGLAGGHYFEPYAGGAGVALELLFHGHVTDVHVNDIDPAVYVFWKAATKYSEDLIRLVNDTPINIREWHRWRDVMNGVVEASEVEKGFATFFLNRTNRSGILKGGVIGGKAQAGTYRLDARFNRPDLVRRLERIAENAGRIHVYCEDAIALLRRSPQFLPRSTLIYLDPPYYVKGQGLYRNYYEHADHVAVAKLLQSPRFTRPWIVSYDNVEEIRQMYRASAAVGYDLKYTAQRRYEGAEVMFFSDRLCFDPTTLAEAAWCAPLDLSSSARSPSNGHNGHPPL
jgi:DNA adenine methylase